MMRERDALDNENSKLEKTLGDDLESLAKKAKYLEKQFNEANSQLRDIVSRGETLASSLHSTVADESSSIPKPGQPRHSAYLHLHSHLWLYHTSALPRSRLLIILYHMHQVITAPRSR